MIGHLYIEGDLNVGGTVEGQLQATGDVDVAQAANVNAEGAGVAGHTEGSGGGTEPGRAGSPGRACGSARERITPGRQGEAEEAVRRGPKSPRPAQRVFRAAGFFAAVGFLALPGIARVRVRARFTQTWTESGFFCQVMGTTT
jgi:hypothetical protein